MRPYRIIRHESATDLVLAFFRGSGAPKAARRQLWESIMVQGMWAFVHIPDTRNKRSRCTVRFWADDTTPATSVIHMLGHELGHIAGTGPRGPGMRSDGRHAMSKAAMREEERADEYGIVAREVAAMLSAMGVISVPGVPTVTPAPTTPKKRQPRRRRARRTRPRISRN